MQKKYLCYQYNFEDVYGQEWEKDPRKIIKDDGQLELGDYYDKSILGEESREELIHRKMKELPKGRNKCRIMQRTIVSGDRVEIDIYPYYLYRRDLPRSEKTRESRKQQKNLNDKNSRKQLIRLMCANFHKGDLILTLTYKDGEYPDLQRARKDMNNYIRRLRRSREKQGLPPLKYIYVIEYVPEGEDTRKVRIHHHMIINSMDRDTAETLWGKGRVESKYAQPDDFELEGFATYISKLSAEKGHRKWEASRNLDKPKEYKSITRLSRKKFAEIIKSGEKKELIESLYKGKFRYLDSTSYISQEYGGFYLYCRLRRKESVWKDVENVQDKENALTERKVDCKAFLEYEWRGSLKDGEAVYSILLEAMYKGTPVTRQYFGRIAHTTKNRALLKMAKEALSHLKPCSVEFHSDGNLLTTGINLNRFERQKKAGYEGIKNAELIEEFLKAAKGFEMAAVSEKKNEYSDAMKIQRELQFNKMIITEDRKDA